MPIVMRKPFWVMAFIVVIALFVSTLRTSITLTKTTTTMMMTDTNTYMNTYMNTTNRNTTRMNNNIMMMTVTTGTGGGRYDWKNWWWFFHHDDPNDGDDDGDGDGDENDKDPRKDAGNEAERSRGAREEPRHGNRHGNRNGDKFDMMEEELMTSISRVRYFMYDDERIVLRNITEDFLSGRNVVSPQQYARFRREALLEHQILLALERHPMRTFNRSEATFFILPFRLGINLIANEHRQFRDVLDLLSDPRGPYYERTWYDGGSNHVLLALNTVTYNRPHKTDVAHLGLSHRWYKCTRKMIVAQCTDDINIANIARRHEQQQSLSSSSASDNGNDNENSHADHDDHDDHGKDLHRHPYEPLFLSLRSVMSQYTFSIGLIAEMGTTIPFLPASYQKYQNASLVLFYRTRREGSDYEGSTEFRRLPLDMFGNHNNNNQSSSSSPLSLQSSSIGYNLPAEQWIRDFTSSQYCLAIRGDTPHTKSVLRSIKVGCIPVIISDWYEDFSPAFPMTLRNMTDYALFISERDFWHDPMGSLHRTLFLLDGQDHDDDHNKNDKDHPSLVQDEPQQPKQQQLKELLRGIEFAQRVTSLDHPDSLFIPAFVREVYETMKKPPSPYAWFRD